MARFLFSVWPLQTHLHPFLAVAQALRRRGHEVCFYTGASARELIEREGMGCRPFHALDESAVNEAVQGVIRRNVNPRQWQRFLLGSVPQQLADLNAIWAEWPPDAVLCDMAMWGPILVLHETKRVPVAILSHVAACLLPGPEYPFPGMGWLFKNLRPRILGRVAAGILQAATSGVRQEAIRLRMSHGLGPFPGSVTEFTGTLPLYLVPGTAEFDSSRSDLPPSVHYVGPCLWDEWNGKEPCMKEATHHTAGSGEGRGGRPRVLATEGALFPNDLGLLRTVAKALADKPLDVVLMAGRRRDPAKLPLGPLPENVRVVPWAPLCTVLCGYDLLIANGDSEIAMAALAAGIPMVAVPVMLDQPEIASRLVDCGAGVRIPGRWCSARAISEAVERVLSDGCYRENAARIAARLAKLNGGCRAAELLEGLVRA
ncbi:MAG TPA: nucleotide disphospho-sugar-binding domain-containing protein [Bryobacteraceae bacterium]|jgi:UDP:flavonoid glycosyltransferase YjiC (YdhE family)|nr:nucleotide disphospho-sugar-binding domain-containing protein [Bryobacteraceae bacterium]